MKLDVQASLRDPAFKKWSIIAGYYVYNKIQTEIAERLEVSRQYVSKVINQYKLEWKFIDKRSTKWWT